MTAEFHFAKLQALLQEGEQLGPWSSLVLFLTASSLMIWRLGVVEKKGVEGTILGTLIMPYCSGLSNLIFAYVLGRAGGSGSSVLENCVVNNVTNLTLLMGLPALFYSMTLIQRNRTGKRGKHAAMADRLNYLSLLLTLIAVMFFTGALYALARDGILDFGDGLMLVGLFLFWQVLHVFEVLKSNVRQRREFSFSLVTDLALIVAGGYGIYLSIEQLVNWIQTASSGNFFFSKMGWLSGILMVLPNAMLALYYGKIGRPDIVYSSQAGDGHICIPMCIGMFALFRNIEITSLMNLGIFIIVASSLIHFLFLAVWGRLPRFVGAALTVAYCFFMYSGLIQ
jgi:cation:H+ antiporter